MSTLMYVIAGRRYCPAHTYNADGSMNTSLLYTGDGLAGIQEAVRHLNRSSRAHRTKAQRDE